ncbi:MAG: hypothetical protein NC191_02970 [Muribaculaceae bacterium]|nr:hypothetical protein [Muribaculaceae bacterium]
MKIGRIFSGIAERVEARKMAKQLTEAKKYVQLPNLHSVPDAAVDLVRDVYRIRGAIAGFAKANDVFVSMGVRETKESLIPKLNIAVHRPATKTERPKTAIRELDIIDESLIYSKRTTRMLENKDGLNYIADCESSTHDNFIRRVYRTIDFLMNDLKK